MGIEALSRGASDAVFVDSSRKAVEVIRKNLNSVGFYSRAKVLHIDSLGFINMNNEQFDIAFLDPPYGVGILQQALPVVAEKIKKTGIIIAESNENDTILKNYGDFVLDRERHYGKIKVSVFRHKDFV